MTDTPTVDPALAAYYSGGQLVSLPRQLDQLRQALAAIQAHFAPDQPYDEAAVEATLAPLATQPGAVHAALVSLGYLRADGAVYYRSTPPATPPRGTPARPPADRTAPVDESAPPDAAERERVLAAYFREGRLVGWPRKLRLQRIVLAAVQERFTPGQVYSEAEVNRIVLAVHDDYCTLRRALVDYGYLRRDHGQYEWAPPPAIDTGVVID